MGPIFRNRSGRPYSKDTLGDDFKAVRELVFGNGETRQLADFRRSGTVEALAGDATPEKLAVEPPAQDLWACAACVRTGHRHRAAARPSQAEGTERG